MLLYNKKAHVRGTEARMRDAEVLLGGLRVFSHIAVEDSVRCHIWTHGNGPLYAGGFRTRQKNTKFFLRMSRKYSNDVQKGKRISSSEEGHTGRDEPDLSAIRLKSIQNRLKG